MLIRFEKYTENTPCVLFCFPWYQTYWSDKLLIIVLSLGFVLWIYFKVISHPYISISLSQDTASLVPTPRVTVASLVIGYIVTLSKTKCTIDICITSANIAKKPIVTASSPIWNDSYIPDGIYLYHVDNLNRELKYSFRKFEYQVHRKDMCISQILF